MRKLLLLLTVFTCHAALAQEDLLKQLEAEQGTETSKEYVAGTFKATRIINGYSVELTGKKDIQFVISHSFGRIQSGWREFFGIDDADMRIGLEYGIFEWWNVGFGRSSVGGTYHYTTPHKFLKQSKGGIPLSMVWYSNIGINSKSLPA